MHTIFHNVTGLLVSIIYIDQVQLNFIQVKSTYYSQNYKLIRPRQRDLHALLNMLVPYTVYNVASLYSIGKKN